MKRLRHSFFNERTLITTTLLYTCHWKTLCNLLLAKEKTWIRIFKTNSELSQNCTEKQIKPSKSTINWLFNDIWCYLFITCFDWKIGIFQQTVVRVYYILKSQISVRVTTTSIFSSADWNNNTYNLIISTGKLVKVFSGSIVNHVVNSYHLPKLFLLTEEKSYQK